MAVKLGPLFDIKGGKWKSKVYEFFSFLTLEYKSFFLYFVQFLFNLLIVVKVIVNLTINECAKFINTDRELDLFHE